jgi:hypothetical protein
MPWTIYKAVVRSDPSNYRPTALLSAVCKAFERMITNFTTSLIRTASNLTAHSLHSRM